VNILGMAAIALTAVGIAGLVTGRLTEYQVDGILAAANGLFSIAAISRGSLGWAVFSGAACAVGAYRWWHGGGGDGTRRRLRAAARQFAAVRRTAPQTAARSIR
jgi:hypothetical protein